MRVRVIYTACNFPIKKTTRRVMCDDEMVRFYQWHVSMLSHLKKKKKTNDNIIEKAII